MVVAVAAEAENDEKSEGATCRQPLATGEPTSRTPIGLARGDSQLSPRRLRLLLERALRGVEEREARPCDDGAVVALGGGADEVALLGGQADKDGRGVLAAARGAVILRAWPALLRPLSRSPSAPSSACGRPRYASSPRCALRSPTVPCRARRYCGRWTRPSSASRQRADRVAQLAATLAACGPSRR